MSVRTPETRTLEALFVEHGETYSTIAAKAVPVYPEVVADLFARVDAGTQPLSVDVARIVADVLDLQTAEVLGRARFITYMVGPIYRRARPPAFGEQFNAAPYRKTAGT